MATIALGIAGSALGGPIGLSIGGAIGSFIDQSLVFPGLFPPDDVIGPRLDSLKLQYQEEGSPVNMILGKQVRVQGTVLWISDLIEVVSDSGGKKTGGVRTGYDYFVDIALSIGGPINKLLKIFADGKLIYNHEPSVSIVSNSIEADNRSVLVWDLVSPNGGPDLSQLQSGYNVDVAGFANGNNNGTFYCVSSSKNAATGVSRVRLQNLNGIDEAAGPTVTISQTLPNWNPSKITNVTIYKGSNTQAPDPLIEAYEDAGKVPGYRGWSYVVLERVHLLEYGQRVPQFSFLVEVSPAATVAAAMGSIMQAAGRDASTYDLSRVEAEDLEGYAVAGPNEAARNLQPLMVASDIIEQERDDKLHFFPRKKATIIDVDFADLAAHESGGDAPRVVTVEKIEDSRIPSEIDVRYLDLQNEDQHGSERARRTQYVTDGVSVIDLPLVMNGARARQIAERVLWSAVLNAEKLRGFLPFKYRHVVENDILRFQAYGRVWEILLRKVDHGANNLIRWEGHLEIREALVQPAISDDPSGAAPQGSLTLPPHITPYIWDPPALIEQHTASPGIYIAAGIPDQDAQWIGALLYSSLDDSLYEFEDLISGEATIGTCFTALAAAAAGYWDEVSTVHVEVFNGTLSNKTALEVLNGANIALIGDEIIGFRKATPIADGEYTLSGLLRGLRGTEDKISGHAVDARFILLENSGLKFIPIDQGEIGVLRHWKVATSGQDLDDVTAVQLTPTGRNVQPFGPVHLAQERNAPSTNDVTLSWVRRTRSLTNFLSFGPAPVLEPEETYEVDIIYPVASSTVVRTKTVTGAQE